MLNGPTGWVSGRVQRSSMEAGGFQHSSISPQSSGGGRSHRRGNYKQIHESRDSWRESTRLLPAEPARDSLLLEPAAAPPPPWFSRSQSQSSVSSSSPAQGGFMLATNLSSSGTQQLSQSLSSSSSSSLIPHHIPTGLSTSPSSSSVEQHHETAPASLLWGEVREKGEEEEGGGTTEGAKWPSRPLWREGWKAEGIVCSMPHLHQHPPPPQNHVQQSSLPFLLDHPRDDLGHNPVLHSSDLQYHIREVEHIIDMSGANFRPSDLPPLPENFGSSKVKRTSCDPLKAPPVLLTELNLDPISVALLLRKSTAAICCHSGFHSTSLRALDSLAGVMGDFMSKLCKQLSIFSESQPPDGQDPLERTLWNCGIQGKAELHKFWKTEIEAGMQQLQRRAVQLYDRSSPSSLPPPPPSLMRPLSLSLTSWPAELQNEKVVDDEISLEDALNMDMDIVAPAATPDPGGVQTFLPDIANQEPEGFVLLTPDLPARKRLRTSGSFTE